MKKVGQVLWGFFQVFTYVLIQLIVGGIAAFIYSVIKYAKLSAQGFSDYYVAFDIILEEMLTSSFTMFASCLISLVSVIIYWIWYKKGYVKGRKAALKKLFTIKNTTLIVLLAISAQIFLITFMGILEAIRPEWFTYYNELMKQFDIGNSMQSLIYVAILGPIVEELLMRGLVLNQMKKAMPFIAANIVQAFLFALLHGNLVQGSYAFVIGLLFGLLYRKYNTILSTILLHIMFNFSGYIINIAFDGVYINIIVIIVVSIITLITSLLLVRFVITDEDNSSIYEVAISTEENIKQATQLDEKQEFVVDEHIMDSKE